MPTHQYLRPDSREDSSAALASLSMPSFVVAQIVRRLRFVCASIFISGIFVALTFQAVFRHRDALADTSVLFSAVVSSVAAALVLFLLRRDRPQRELVGIAIVFEGAVAFACAMHDGFWHYAPDYLPEARPFFSCIWMLMYPLIVPLPPRLALGSALGSFAMVMLAIGSPFLLAPERVAPFVIFRMAAETHLLIAVLAYGASRMVSHMNWQIATERKKGSYELTKLLGSGSMGEVWLARHRMLHRPAAMKIIQKEKLEAATEDLRLEVVERFQREAQATASLFSQHSISLYDFGTMEDGSFFYVMEALDGLDLADIVNVHGKMPPARAVHVLLQICESLSEAHRIGLIHRDLKPANVYLCRYGLEADFVKVLDFGMVKYSSERDESASKRPSSSANVLSPELTQHGHITGTPAYMAPEMIRHEKIDHRYDIYALGCVAYWLLTASHVFKARSFEKQLVAHVRDDPEPPGERRGEPLPQELEDLILDCLAKKPEDRPQTVDQIAVRLRSIPLADSWTQVDAKAWWEANVPKKDWHLSSGDRISSASVRAKDPGSIGNTAETKPSR